MTAIEGQVLQYSQKSLKLGMFDQFFSNSISITSSTAVGKTTTINLLRQKLVYPYRFVSAGSIMRQHAARHGLSIERFAALCKHKPEIDRACDRDIMMFAQQNFVIAEGRLVHVFMRHSFHVLLTCDLNVRTMRRYNDKVNSPRNPNLCTTLDSVRNEIYTRDSSDVDRYSTLYPGCIWKKEEFDLVIDTGISTPEYVAKTIIDAHAAWQLANQHRLCHGISLVSK